MKYGSYGDSDAEREDARLMEVRSAIPHSVMVSQINAAVLAEREACAKIAEAVADEAVAIETGGMYCGCGEEIAAAIRKRKP